MLDVRLIRTNDSIKKLREEAEDHRLQLECLRLGPVARTKLKDRIALIDLELKKLRTKSVTA